MRGLRVTTEDPRALSQQRDLPASRQGRRDRSGERDSAGRRGGRPKLVQEWTSVRGVAWPCAQAAIERRTRPIIRHQQAWRSLSAHFADPRRSRRTRTGSGQAGSTKPVARRDAAAATPQHCRCRAREQEYPDRLEPAHQRYRLRSQSFSLCSLRNPKKGKFQPKGSIGLA